MKIEQQRRKLGSSGYEEILDYQIEASSKAFEILFKNIYSDPIKAILRELGTNAYDSHIEAGKKDVPFDLHLPSHFDPTFYIRDYGVGLDGDELKNIYRVVFKSTKTNSNEQVGCFGLGCKTPFAYTDNYLIESFKDGKRYACNAFYGDTAKPSLAFTVNGEPTKEPNGLKVTLVCKNDYAYWVEKTREVYRFFKTKPNILGVSKIAFPENKYVMEGDDWALRSYTSNPYSYGHNTTGIIAIMGQIPYAINTNSLKDLSHEQIRLATCGIDLRFQIGELAVEANREGIHLNDRSCEAIKAKLEKILKELGKKIEDEVANETCLWDASVKLRSISSSIYDISRIINTGNLKWKGKKLLETFYLSETLLSKMTYYVVETHYSRGKKYSRSAVSPEDTVFFYADADAPESRIKQYELTNQTNKRLVLLEDVPVDPLVQGPPKPNTKSGVDEFLDLIDLPRSRVINVSTLPKMPSKKRTYNRAKTSKVNELKNGSWVDADIDLKDGEGFYVEMYQQHTIFRVRNKLSKPAVLPIKDHEVDRSIRARLSTRRIQLSVLINLRNSLDRLGFPVYNIYGIRSSHIPRLGPRWKCFYHYAQSKLGYIMDLHQYEEKIPGKISSHSPISYSHYFEDIFKKVDKGTPFARLGELTGFSKRREEVIDCLNSYCGFFGEEPNIKEIDCQDEVNKILDKYYILNKIPSYHIHHNEAEKFVNSAVSYINSLGDKL